MLIIPIKEGENIDRALKRYKRKFDRTKTMKNLRARKNFTKPSVANSCLLYTSPSPRDLSTSRMPSSA